MSFSIIIWNGPRLFGAFLLSTSTSNSNSFAPHPHPFTLMMGAISKIRAIMIIYDTPKGSLILF